MLGSRKSAFTYNRFTGEGDGLTYTFDIQAFASVEQDIIYFKVTSDYPNSYDLKYRIETQDYNVFLSGERTTGYVVFDVNQCGSFISIAIDTTYQAADGNTVEFVVLSPSGDEIARSVAVNLDWVDGRLVASVPAEPLRTIDRNLFRISGFTSEEYSSFDYVVTGDTDNILLGNLSGTFDPAVGLTERYFLDTDTQTNLTFTVTDTDTGNVFFTGTYCIPQHDINWQITPVITGTKLTLNVYGDAADTTPVDLIITDPNDAILTENTQNTISNNRTSFDIYLQEPGVSVEQNSLDDILMQLFYVTKKIYENSFTVSTEYILVADPGPAGVYIRPGDGGEPPYAYGDPLIGTIVTNDGTEIFTKTIARFSRVLDPSVDNTLRVVGVYFDGTEYVSLTQVFSNITFTAKSVDADNYDIDVLVVGAGGANNNFNLYTSSIGGNSGEYVREILPIANISIGTEYPIIVGGGSDGNGRDSSAFGLTANGGSGSPYDGLPSFSPGIDYKYLDFNFGDNFVTLKAEGQPSQTISLPYTWDDVASTDFVSGRGGRGVNGDGGDPEVFLSSNKLQAQAFNGTPGLGQYIDGHDLYVCAGGQGMGTDLQDLQSIAVLKVTLKDGSRLTYTSNNGNFTFFTNYGDGASSCDPAITGCAGVVNIIYPSSRRKFIAS